MKKIIGSIGVLVLVIIVAIGTLTTKSSEETILDKLKNKYSEKQIASVDHSKFAELQKKFNSPREVTAECITCHNKRHEEVMHSNHWNWEREEYIEGRGIVSIGKKNIMNNFCIGTQGNEKSCAKCHIVMAWMKKENHLPMQIILIVWFVMITQKLMQKLQIKAEHL